MDWRFDGLTALVSISVPAESAVEPRYEKALNDFSNAIDSGVVDPYALNGSGLVYGALDREQERLADRDRAIAVEPTNVEAYIDRGSAFSNLKKFEKGLEDLNYAIRKVEVFYPVLDQTPPLVPTPMKYLVRT